MLISKENRKIIYQTLFQEGVLVAKKDFEIKHPEIEIPNLQVIKCLQSLNSKGYVKTQFSWQYYYYTLTNEGIEYLRQYLNLPAEIVPRTFLKQAKPLRKEGEGQKRQGQGEFKKDFPKKDVTNDYKAEFRGGIGRGQPQ